MNSRFSMKTSSRRFTTESNIVLSGTIKLSKYKKIKNIIKFKVRSITVNWLDAGTDLENVTCSSRDQSNEKEVQDPGEGSNQRVTILTNEK